jgi:DNA-binding XRE family transcriptional regulator
MLNFDLATQQEIRTELGTRLRAQRIAQSLTQDELAARAGISLSTVKRMEKSCDTAFEALIRVAMALGLAAQFESLFSLQIKSIAQMEQVASTYHVRVRASRKAKTPSKVALKAAPKAAPTAKPPPEA